jgi:hypothetical protein
MQHYDFLLRKSRLVSLNFKKLETRFAIFRPSRQSPQQLQYYNFAYLPNIHTHPNTARDGFLFSAKSCMHVQFGLALLVLEDCAYSAGFMDAFE